MSDIVERLRERPFRMASETAAEAKERRQREREEGAAEIDRLRAENDGLRAMQLTVLVEQGNMVASLRAENERLRAALRPFAEAADGFDAARIKNPEEWFAYRGIVSATEAKGAITVGDLRRARAALEGK